MTFIEDMKKMFIERLEKRFWDKVVKTDKCWIWRGTRHPSGHGAMSVGGRKGRPYMVHRISYELHYGSIPDDLCVCHKCDNPPCVRPDHLFIGDRKDNLDDMRKKNRQARGKQLSLPGEQHYNAKLTETQVLEIRKRHAEGELASVLAAEYGCGHENICSIAYRRTWKHI